MRLVADECVPADVVALLRAAGHEVHAIWETRRGATDDEVLGVAAELKCPLVKKDLDFGEMVFRRGQASAGVILLRMSGVPNAEKGSVLLRALQEHVAELSGAFLVVSATSVRVRPSSGA